MAFEAEVSFYQKAGELTDRWEAAKATKGTEGFDLEEYNAAKQALADWRTGVRGFRGEPAVTVQAGAATAVAGSSTTNPTTTAN